MHSKHGYFFIFLHSNQLHYEQKIFVLDFSSGNRTPGSRSYSDLVDTGVDSLCIQWLVLEGCLYRRQLMACFN